MSNTRSPSQKYQSLLDALYEENIETPEPEHVRLLDREAVFACAEVRAGKLRFATAKRGLANSATVVLKDLSADAISRGRAILQALAQREPALSGKFSLAFRNGKELSDDEVIEILRELQTLGVNLDDVASSKE